MGVGRADRIVATASRADKRCRTVGKHPRGKARTPREPSGQLGRPSRGGARARRSDRERYCRALRKVPELGGGPGRKGGRTGKSCCSTTSMVVTRSQPSDGIAVVKNIERELVPVEGIGLFGGFLPGSRTLPKVALCVGLSLQMYAHECSCILLSGANAPQI